MSDEYSLESDDIFSGDLGFDDDFSGSKPFSVFGTVNAFASGIFQGVVGTALGNIDGTIKTARFMLPKTFSTFLTKVEFLERETGRLLTEVKENTYSSVKTLQSIAHSYTEKSSIAKRFANADFSSWENGKGKSSYSFSHENKEDELSEDSIAKQMDMLINKQRDSIKEVSANEMEMSAAIGGRTIAELQGGNNQLIGVQLRVKELTDYQRNVQYKLDNAKIELLARTYLTNARYFKFVEKAFHTSIQELKKITEHTGMSEYQKTSLYDETKDQIRKGLLGATARKTGGFLNFLTNRFGEDGRKGIYDLIRQGANALPMTTMAIDSGELSIEKISGVVGEIAGNEIYKKTSSFLNQGMFESFLDRIFIDNPKEREKLDDYWNTLTKAGSVASHASSSLTGLLNHYAPLFKNFTETNVEEYDEYVERMKAEGKTPMAETTFNARNKILSMGKSALNSAMSEITESTGSTYSLDDKDARALVKTAPWREINSITLNDVIPGWLSRIYESLEKTRTGNDDFDAPMFSYSRGQFINKDVGMKMVENSIFEHSQFSLVAKNALSIIDKIDDPKNPILTDEQRKEIAFKILRDVDKGNKFSPYYYVNNIDGVSKDTEYAVNHLMRKKFGIDDERLKEFNNAGPEKKIMMSLSGFSSENNELLTRLNESAAMIERGMPDIGETFAAARQSGSEQAMRDMGLIVNTDGKDSFNMDVLWNKFREYIDNPDNSLLKGDLGELDENNAGDTRGAIKFRRAKPKGEKKEKPVNVKGIEETNKAFARSVKMLSETIDGLSNVFTKQKDAFKIDLDTIPDNVSMIRTLVEEIKNGGVKSVTLLETISECVDRQAGGWVKKNKREKEKIVREETNAKKTFADKIRSLYPRQFINNGIDTLIKYQPAILSGALAALGGYGLAGTNGAMIGGAVGVASAALGIHRTMAKYAKADMPSDDEDIYDDSWLVLLQSAKLKAGHYFDATARTVIKTWLDIKGPVYDAAKRTFITINQLTGKLRGSDGRPLFIKGLDKFKDKAVELWKRLDPAEVFKKGLSSTKNYFFQIDVYVKGDKHPRLTKRKFKDKRYYKLDQSGRNPTLINDVSDIDGPVYELDNEDNLNQVVSELEYAEGLITANGMAIGKLKKVSSYLGSKTLAGLITAKNYAANKAGKFTENLHLRTDVSGVEERLDKIYDLLAGKYHRPEQGRKEETGTKDPNNNKPDEQIKTPFTADEIIDHATNEKESRYPKKVRLNSLEDQKIQEEERKKNDFFEDIHKIRTNLENRDKNNEKDKDKSLFAKIAGVLLGGAALIKKMFTNPLGFMADITGMMFKTLFNSSKRLMTLGSLLFRGALGASSGIYKLITSGFRGTIAAVRAIASGSLFASLIGGGKKYLSKAAQFAKNVFGRTKGSKLLKYGAAATATAGGMAFASNAYAGTDHPGENINTNDEVLNVPEEQFDDPFAEEAEEASNDFGGAAADAAMILGPSLLAKGAKTTKYGAAALAKMGAKAGSRFIPGVGQALMAYDGLSGFTDGEEVADIFDTNYINGRQRMANYFTTAFDMGGLVSGTMGGLADLTGIEALRPEGGMTRAIENILQSSSGILFTDIAAYVLGKWDSDMSSTQRKIRLTLYGLDYTNNELGRLVEVLESEIGKYTIIGKKDVRIDSRAPVGQLLGSFAKDNRKDIVDWYKGRFEPIYKAWVLASSNVGFIHVKDCDKDKEGFAIKVVERTRAAITTLNPYPLDIVVEIDKETKTFDKEETDKRIDALVEKLKSEMKEKGFDDKGDIILDNKIATEKEIREGMEKDKTSGKANGWFYTPPIDDKKYPQPAEIISIDISDLHKSGSSNIDELTMVRLAAYGNTENKAINVDTVLKLERYCETMFTFVGTSYTFIGKTNDIFNLFKNTFRVEKGWGDIWVEWFNTRFVPVLTTWCSEVMRLRRTTPEKCWVTLVPSAKHEIARSLVETKVINKEKTISVWDVKHSPFVNTESGTNADVTTPQMRSLERKAFNNKVTSDKVDDDSSNSVQNESRKYLTPSQQKALEDKLNSGIAFSDNDFQNLAPANLADNKFGMGGGDAADPTNTTVTTPGGVAETASKGDVGEVPKLNISQEKMRDLLISEFVKAGITDERVIAYALANAEIESNFQPVAEGFNYKYEPGKSWGNVTGWTEEVRKKYGRIEDRPGHVIRKANQQAIASAGYDHHSGLGNKGPGEGWKYRGRGLTQISGRYNYTEVGKLMGVDLLSDPDLLIKDPNMAVKSVVEFFKWKKIPEAVMAGRIEGREGANAKVGAAANNSRKTAGYYKYLNQIKAGNIKIKQVDSIATDTQPNSENNKGEGNENKTAASAGDNREANIKEQIIAANDTAAQAAGKVNLPPQNGQEENTVTTSPIKTPVVVPVTPIRQTPPPPQTASSSPEETPQKSQSKSKESQTPVIAEVKMPEGTMAVHDEQLVTALNDFKGALVEVLDKVSQPPAQPQPSPKRIGVGQRTPT